MEGNDCPGMKVRYVSVRVCSASNHGVGAAVKPVACSYGSMSLARQACYTGEGGACVLEKQSRGYD